MTQDPTMQTREEVAELVERLTAHVARDDYMPAKARRAMERAAVAIAALRAARSALTQEGAKS